LEREKWKVFRQRLHKKDRKKFDEMLDYSRLYNSAGGYARRSILKHPILMSIIFEHFKQLAKIVNESGIDLSGSLRNCVMFNVFRNR
jgi:hypothetical protein